MEFFRGTNLSGGGRAVGGFIEYEREFRLRVLGMYEERRATINVGAQHAQAFVGCVPRLHDDIVEFVAQEIFDYPLVPRFDFQEIGEHAYRARPPCMTPD